MSFIFKYTNSVVTYNSLFRMLLFWSIALFDEAPEIDYYDAEFDLVFE